MQPLEALASRLGRLLRQHDLQVSTAESCTGGGIAEIITRIPGSSAWFEAGFVTYSNRQKTALLDVPADLLAREGAVCAAVVEAMALAALQKSGAALAVAVSGLAGPGGGTAELPVGTVWLGWADAGGAHSRCFLFAGDRQSVRQQAIEQALLGLLAMLDHHSSGMAGD